MNLILDQPPEPSPPTHQSDQKDLQKVQTKRHRWIAALLVLGLGIGLHLTFRGLSSDLPRLFPQIARETPPDPLPSQSLNEFAESIESFGEGMDAEDLGAPPPPSKVVMKKSGEVATAKAPPKSVEDRRFLRTLQSTSVPIPPRTGKEGTSSQETFQIPADLEPMVDFWRKIYAVYDKNQVVFHDTEDLSVQYGVLDFSSLEKKSLSDEEKKSIRDSEIQREIQRIQAGLADPRARERVRAQTGLKHRFREGIENSGKYLPLFEQIFQSYGVPREISRLAFVESIFRERALSKVGAAGLWQFMSGTARKFMVVDHLVDERYDPIKATHGAARLLLKNYELLGTWPLAINAYNSGPGNLLKAVSTLGSRDIATIIKNYRTGSYSFASRNFYPCFLAALSAYENRDHYFGSLRQSPIWDFDVIELPATMTFPEIAHLSEVPMDKIRELNPAFSPQVFEGSYSLPAGTQVRISVGCQERFAARFVNYSRTEDLPIHLVGTPQPEDGSLVRNRF